MGSALTIHFGRGKPPSAVLLDYMTEADAWMLDTVVDKAFLRDANSTGWAIIDCVRPDWREHVQRNTVAYAHVVGAVARAHKSYASAWASYLGEAGSGDGGEPAPRFSPRFSTRLKSGRMGVGGVGHGGTSASLMVRFGPRGDLGKVSKNFFVSDAAPTFQMFSTPADRRAHALDTSSSKTGCPVCSGKQKVEAKLSTGTNADLKNPSSTLSYVWRLADDWRSVIISIGAFPVAAGGVKSVGYREPPLTLSSSRIEERPLLISRLDNYFSMIVDIRWAMNGRVISEDFRRVFGNGDSTATRSIINGVFHYEFSEFSAISYFGPRPLMESGRLSLHLSTRIEELFPYAVLEPGVSLGDVYDSEGFDEPELKEMGWCIPVDVGAGDRPLNDEPDWSVNLIRPEDCLVGIASAWFVSEAMNESGSALEYVYHDTVVLVTNPSDHPISVSRSVGARPSTTDGVNSVNLAPGETKQLGGGTSEPMSFGMYHNFYGLDSVSAFETRIGVSSQQTGFSFYITEPRR